MALDIDILTCYRYWPIAFSPVQIFQIQVELKVLLLKVLLWPLCLRLTYSCVELYWWVCEWFGGTGPHTLWIAREVFDWVTPPLYIAPGLARCRNGSAPVPFRCVLHINVRENHTERFPHLACVIWHHFPYDIERIVGTRTWKSP